MGIVVVSDFVSCGERMTAGTLLGICPNKERKEFDRKKEVLIFDNGKKKLRDVQ